MKLRTYTEIAEGRLPKVPDSFSEAIKTLSMVFEGELSSNVVKYVFYGSAARGDATVSSDLDLLLIVKDYNPLIAEMIKDAIQYVEKTTNVPVESCITEVDLLLTKFHFLSPGYMRHVVKFVSDGGFPNFEECTTIDEEIRSYTSLKIHSFSTRIAQPFCVKLPLSENENFLELVGKARDVFVNQVRKIVYFLENDGATSIFEEYKKIASSEQVELFKESFKFRRDYDNLILSNPSEEDYENFLQIRGKKIIWSAIEFLKGNITLLEKIKTT